MIRKHLRRALVAGILLFCVNSINAQLAIKNNLLYDATLTPNLGFEYGIGQKNTVQIFYGLNAWEFGKNSQGGKRQAKHWVLMPEYRWWTCTKFNGLFYGIHAMGGQFNAGNVNIPLPGAFVGGGNVRSMVKDSRVEGSFLGAGVTVGYQRIMSRHWNIEAEIGVGYDHVWYDQYPCADCGTKIKSGSANYIGVTKLGVSLLYLF